MGTMPAMELYQLKTFIAVAAEGNLTRAAERVFTSVPAVSAQVKALEDELGVKLFERSSKGMTLTEAGHRLLEEAHRTIDAAQRMRSAAAQIRGEATGVVRMGTVSDPVSLRLGDVFVRLAERHPHVVLQLQQGLSLRTIEAVRRGDLDCAYAMNGRETIEGLDVLRLTPLEVVVAVPRRLALEHAPESLEALTRLPWIATPPECGLRPSLENLFGLVGRELPQGAMADNEGAVRGMVASGIGVGLMRLDSAQKGEREGELAIWPGWRGQTWLCWIGPAAARAEPAVQAVREVVREAWA